MSRSAPSTVLSAILGAKIQVFIDFGVVFGKKMLQEDAFSSFFSNVRDKLAGKCQCNGLLSGNNRLLFSENRLLTTPRSFKGRGQGWGESKNVLSYL